MTYDLLTTEDVARLAGIQPASVRRNLYRNSMPQPDGRVGRTLVWERSTITEWLSGRSEGRTGGSQGIV